MPGWQLRGRGATAGAEDPLYIRMGTSGGIGTDAGTVVVATEGVDGLLRPVPHARAPCGAGSICTIGFPFFLYLKTKSIHCCGAVRATNGRAEDREAEQQSARVAETRTDRGIGARRSTGDALSCGARQNENCTGLAQIVSQLQGSNRDFESKCCAKSHNSG